MRPIDADELISNKFKNPISYQAFVNLVKRQPTIEPKRGEWIVHFDDLFPEESTKECSICKAEQPLGIDDNFCPNCGAKMKGE